MAIPLSTGDLRVQVLRLRGSALPGKMRKLSPSVAGLRSVVPLCDHELNRQVFRNNRLFTIAIAALFRHATSRYEFFEGRACVLPQILLDRDYFLNRLSATAGREMQAIKGRVRKIQGKR
jgi:hypothetical protein